MPKKKKISQPVRTSWKKIPQKAGKQSVTKESQLVKFRRWMRIIGFSFGSCTLVLGASLGGYYLFNTPASTAFNAGAESPVEVEIQTDGFLPESWIELRLDLDHTLGLMQIDMRDLKANLEKYPQIANASVERRFPNMLRVMVRERYPVFRMKVKGTDGRYSILLVDEEGHVFENINCPEHLLRRIPFLAGVVLHRTLDGYQQIDGVKTLANLIHIAKRLYPDLSRDWMLVLADQLILAETFTHGYIRVRSKTIEEILFAPKDFEKQLERLKYILDSHAGSSVSYVSRVNLSLLDQPTVEFTRRSSTNRHY